MDQVGYYLLTTRLADRAGEAKDNDKGAPLEVIGPPVSNSRLHMSSSKCPQAPGCWIMGTDATRWLHRFAIQKE